MARGEDRSGASSSLTFHGADDMAQQFGGEYGSQGCGRRRIGRLPTIEDGINGILGPILLKDFGEKICVE